MAKPKRRSLFVDRRVQGSLLARTFLYWLFCVFSIMLMLICWQLVRQPLRLISGPIDELWSQYGPALVAAILLLPIILLDTLRVSNKFAGPISRMRGVMQQLAKGEEAEPVKFRDNDFWQDFASDLNRVVERIKSLENTAAAPREEIEIGA